MTTDAPARYDVGVVGLGYLGLIWATVLAGSGYRVVGIERDPRLVEMTNQGIPHVTEAGMPDALEIAIKSGRLNATERIDDSFSCDAYLITVGTPVDAHGVVRFDGIEAASRDIAENMPDGALVIQSASVKIGTTRNVVSPILAASGKRFDIAVCPERTLEGNALQELRELPQIIGADDGEAADRAAGVFRRVTSSIVLVSSPETAEMIKLADSTYRDVQFAFANELARACDAVGVSAHEVIASAKVGYARANVPLPGLVGGSRLDKDPHILLESVRDKGIDLEVTRAGRTVNERQPIEGVSFIGSEIARRKLAAPLQIAILGMAFKGVPDTGDLRGSMSIKVLEALRAAHPDAEIGLYDPVTPPDVLAAEFPGAQIYHRFGDAVRGSAVVVIANNHPSLGTISPRTMTEFIVPGGFIFDYWNHFGRLPASERGDSYFALGNLSAVC